MSRHHIERITCPKCQKQSDFVIWDSINTTLDPVMKEKVRNGDAFSFICPECNNQTNVYYATLYHQMEDRVMIYLVFDNIEKTVDLIRGFIKSPIDENDDLIHAHGYRNRVVCSVEQFYEKLRILDAELDDRVVELTKLMLFSQLTEENESIEVDEILFLKTENNNLVFIININNDLKVAEIALDTYKKIESLFSKRIKNCMYDVIIDYEWAADMWRNI